MNVGHKIMIEIFYKVPHGIGGGIFLPYIIKYNINNGFYGYGELYQKNKIFFIINQ